MSDDVEDRLRRHLAATAAGVDSTPDPGGLVDRASGRSPRRGLVAGGVAALTAVVAGVGILVGATVVGTSPTALTPTGSAATGAGRAGADLVPAANIGVPSDASQAPYTFAFSRVSTSGVTVRAYSSAITGVSGCSGGTDCTPPVSVPITTPCDTGDTCARPLVSPPVSTGTGQSTGSGTTSTSGSTTQSADCSQVVVELSTDRAVGTGSVVRPSSAAPSPDTVDILGSGSFGSAEGSPTGWVTVWVGSAVASVQLTDGGLVVDAMDPVDGLAVLTDTVAQGIAGATVVGLGPTGATVASQAADQSGVPDVAAGCPVTTTPSSTTTAPTTTTTTTAPPTPTITTAPTTTTPTITTDPATTPSTTVTSIGGNHGTVAAPGG